MEWSEDGQVVYRSFIVGQHAADERCCVQAQRKENEIDARFAALLRSPRTADACGLRTGSDENVNKSFSTKTETPRRRGNDAASVERSIAKELFADCTRIGVTFLREFRALNSRSVI